MSADFTFRQRIRYRFDNALSRGVWVLLLWLGLLVFVFLFVVAAVLALSTIGPDENEVSWTEAFWLGLTHTLDPGTFVDASGGRFRILMLIVTIIGILILATIIGLVSSGIDSRLAQLQRGRSLVVEEGHTVIIGRSDKLSTVISQLVEANRSERGRAIVVMTPDDPIDVTDDVRAAVPDMGTSHLVVRSGSPTRLHDLNQVNPQGAKSVVVLLGEGESDAHAVKVVLAVAGLVPDLSKVHLVAEMNDEATAAALRDAIGPALITVTPKEMIGRIGAQVSRSRGIGAVYEEVLDFAGDEFYSTPVGQPWVGRNYGELLLASSTSTVVGIRRRDGETQLNPPPLTAIEDGDWVIAISEDDSTLRLDLPPEPWSPPSTFQRLHIDRFQENTLLVGWSELAPLTVEEIDSSVLPGSKLHVLVNPLLHDTAELVASLELRNQDVTVHEGDPISRRDIASAMADGPYDHVMIIAERGVYNMEEADARTLLTLMHVRALTDAEGLGNIVAEILNPDTVDLGGGTSSEHDFIVSEKLISLLVAQLSESPELAAVFADLFSSEGSVLEHHAIEEFMAPGEVTYEKLIRIGRDFGVTVLGVVSHSSHPNEETTTVRLNPAKGEVLTFADGDRVVLLRRVADEATLAASAA